MILQYARLSDIILIGFIIILSISVFVFWLWMLIDAIRFSKNNNNMQWIFVIAFLGFIGAVIYFFAGRKKRIKKTEDPYAGIVEQD
jgi:hypothetical protein